MHSVHLLLAPSLRVLQRYPVGLFTGGSLITIMRLLECYIYIPQNEPTIPA